MTDDAAAKAVNDWNNYCGGLNLKAHEREKLKSFIAQAIRDAVADRDKLRELVATLWAELGRDQYYVGQELTQQVADALGGVETVHQGFVAARIADPQEGRDA